MRSGAREPQLLVMAPLLLPEPAGSIPQALRPRASSQEGDGRQETLQGRCCQERPREAAAGGGSRGTVQLAVWKEGVSYHCSARPCPCLDVLSLALWIETGAVSSLDLSGLGSEPGKPAAYTPS